MHTCRPEPPLHIQPRYSVNPAEPGWLLSIPQQGEGNCRQVKASSSQTVRQSIYSTQAIYSVEPSLIHMVELEGVHCASKRALISIIVHKHVFRLLAIMIYCTLSI